MKAAGILPCRRQWAWLVTPDNLFGIPQWAQAAAIRGLGKINGRVWLWPTDARKLVREARTAGWQCSVTRVELRHCAVCERPWVGSDAEHRRKLDESGSEGRLLPCGPDCYRDKEAGIWRKLNPSARTAGSRARAFGRIDRQTEGSLRREE